MRYLFWLLQWSHGHSTVETLFHPAQRRVDFHLQWSHGHSTVETTTVTSRCPLRPTLQWSHGHSTVETGCVLFQDNVHRPAFNGATAIRPWKPRISPSPSSCPTSFDGATAIRPWKPLEELDYLPGDEDPSMEPRPFDRGNRKSGRGPVGTKLTFNGATAIRPWKLLN